MKKLRFLLLLVYILSTNTLWAQYHRTGDTLNCIDSIYWRPVWLDTMIDTAYTKYLTHTWGFAVSTGGEWLMMHVLDRPIRVIGIACGVESRGMNDLSYYTEGMTVEQEYFRIYRERSKEGDVPLRSVPWDPTVPHRYYISQSRSSNSSCDTIIYGWPYVNPLYEVYFEDNPLVLTDTFYIGMTSHSYCTLSAGYYPRGFAMNSGEPCGSSHVMTYLLTLDYSNGVIPAGEPYARTTNKIWYIFPILSQDTNFSLLDSCPAAGRVRIDTSDGGSVLRWEADSLHTQWQLGIADTGAASPWLDTMLTEPFFDLAAAGIAPPFSVQVRPHCLCYEFYEVWGDWGDCTVFLPEPCNPVSNLQYLPSGHGRGTLAWTSDTLHTLWQVTLGDTGTAPEEAWIDTLVAVPFLAIDSLGLTSAFTAHVRANCGGDNWSDWSEGLFVDPFLDSTGISQPMPVTTRLVPNPANGLVRAVSDVPLLSVEAYDLAGRRMFTLPASGSEATFDVSSWPAATYIVILRTPEGTIVHRLAVK